MRELLLFKAAGRYSLEEYVQIWVSLPEEMEEYVQIWVSLLGGVRPDPGFSLGGGVRPDPGLSTRRTWQPKWQYAAGS